MKRSPYIDKINQLRARIPDPELSDAELQALPYKERRRIENAKDALERALEQHNKFLARREIGRKSGKEHGKKALQEYWANRPKKPGRPKSRGPMSYLNQKQRDFVFNVVHNQMTHSAAARAAGYPHPGMSGYRLSQSPRVQKAIAMEREKYAKASGVTKKKVIDGMLEAAEMAKMKSDPTGMVQAWREVGKLCGHYEPTKHEVSISVNGQIVQQRINQMSDEELLALAEKEAIEGEFEEVTEDEESEYLALSAGNEEDEDEEPPEYGVEDEFPEFEEDDDDA